MAEEYIMRPAGTGMVTGLQDMVRTCYNALGRPLRMLEIGSYRGESATIIMATCLVESLTCVDAWENGYDEVDVASYLTPMTDIEKQFDCAVASFTDKVFKVKAKSSDAVNMFMDGYFDVVYIDGIHTYEGCKADIQNYIGKVVKGGFLAGHDYPYPSIVKAIQDTIQTIDQQFADSSWIKRV